MRLLRINIGLGGSCQRVNLTNDVVHNRHGVGNVHIAIAVDVALQAEGIDVGNSLVGVNPVVLGGIDRHLIDGLQLYLVARSLLRRSGSRNLVVEGDTLGLTAELELAANTTDGGRLDLLRKVHHGDTLIGSQRFTIGIDECGQNFHLRGDAREGSAADGGNGLGIALNGGESCTASKGIGTNSICQSPDLDLPSMVATGISYAWTSGTKPNLRLSIIGVMIPLVRSKNYAQKNYMARTIARGVDEACKKILLL